MYHAVFHFWYKPIHHNLEIVFGGSFHCPPCSCQQMRRLFSRVGGGQIKYLVVHTNCRSKIDSLAYSSSFIFSMKDDESAVPIMAITICYIASRILGKSWILMNVWRIWIGIMFRKIEMGQRVLILRLSGNDIPSDKQKITPLTETGESYSN